MVIMTRAPEKVRDIIEQWRKILTPEPPAECDVPVQVPPYQNAPVLLKKDQG